MMASPGQDGIMVGGSMMVRTKTIPENAMNASNLTTLVAAVKAAGLVEALSGPGPLTVFAPTNTAFEKLPAGTVDGLLKPEKKTQLQAVLKHHVVAGSYKAADLKDGMMLTTLNGDKLTVTVKNGKVMVDGATVTTADVIDSNGVSHIIDTVLVPKS
jgi:uncharacterized surface protein with fasciclin (FAS1) repeats